MEKPKIDVASRTQQTSWKSIGLLNTIPDMMGRVAYNKLLAIVDVISMGANLVEGTLVSGGCCAVLALGVKNTVNSTNWNRIKGSLADKSIIGY